MIDRPYAVLSGSMSLDGYLDDATDRRLALSNDTDLDRVDELRAGCDAGDSRFPWCSEHRTPRVETKPVGDVVLVRYALSDRCNADQVLVGRSEAA